MILEIIILFKVIASEINMDDPLLNPIPDLIPPAFPDARFQPGLD